MSSDSDEDDFTSVKTKGTKHFGPSGTRQASVKWFKETQIKTVMKPGSTEFVDWFHGIISRRCVAVCSDFQSLYMHRASSTIGYCIHLLTYPVQYIV